jgi:RNA polymerase sigma-70 factor (ECF subfamily)
MNVRSEHDLVEAALRGDPVAFAALVAPKRGHVIAVVARIVGTETAEDVVQEALLRAFLSLSRLRDHGRFESWLCGVAINVAKMRLRRRDGRRAKKQLIAAATAPGHVPGGARTWKDRAFIVDSQPATCRGRVRRSQVRVTPDLFTT